MGSSSLAGASGTFTFNNTSISGAAGPAIQVNATSTGDFLFTNATINNTAGPLLGSSSTGGSLTLTGGSIVGSGTGINIQANGDVNVDIPVTLSGTRGIEILGASGNVSFSDVNISNTVDRGIRINGVVGSPSIAFNGTTTLQNTGVAAIDIDNNTADISFANIDVSSPSGQGIVLSNLTGSLAVTGTTTIDNPTQEGILIDSVVDAAATLQFGDVNITNRNDHAILVQNAQLASVMFGNVSVGARSSGNDAGILLQGNDAPFTFGGASIADSGGSAIEYRNNAKNFTVTGTTTVTSANNAGVLLVTNNPGLQYTFGQLNVTSDREALLVDSNGTLTVAGGTLVSNNDSVLDIQNTALNAIFTSLTSSNSGGEGILLQSNTGSFAVTGMTTIDNPTQEGILIDNVVDAAATLQFGDVNITNRNDTGIEIDNTAVASIGFGTVSISNANNAGGYGIRVGSSNAAVTFAVTNISDTVENTAETLNANDVPTNDGDGDGIFLSNNTGSVTINGGTIGGAGDEIAADGIDVRNSANLTLNNVTIRGTGFASTSAFNSGIQFIDATGVNTINGSTLSDNRGTTGSGILIRNTNTNGTVTVDNSLIEDPFAMGQGIFVDLNGTAQLTLNVQNNTQIDGQAGDGLSIGNDPTFSGNLDLSLINSQISNNGARGVDIVGGNTGRFDVLVNNNTISGTLTANENVRIDTQGNAMANATITNNTITNLAGDDTIDMDSQGAGSVLCGNITGNTLNSGAGTVRLDESAGTFNITQSTAAALAAANGIPAGNVTVVGTPAFNQAPCPIP